MAKKDRSLDKLLNGVEVGGAPAAKELAAEVPLSPTKPITSRMIPPSEKSDLLTRGQRQTYALTLPVSKRQVSCSHIMLDPEKCVVASFNRRVQSLLTIDDPSIGRLVESMRSEGQREPVLARPVHEGGEVVRYELVWGSRRRFAAAVLNKELADRGGFLLRAWVSSEIPDVDAARLSRTENEDREAISPWETAISLAKIQEENAGWTHDVIAAQEGIDRSLVGRYLSIATLPESLVRMVLSPKKLELNVGVRLAKVWKNLDQAMQEKARIAISDKVPFPDGTALEKAIRDYLQYFETNRAKVPTRGKTVLQSESGDVSVALGKHRSRPNSFSIDLEGLSDKDIEKVMRWFQDAFKVMPR